MKADHPLTQYLPERADQDALTMDIAQNGVREPVYLYEGKVVEGRVRQRAAAEAGAQPQYKDWVLLDYPGAPLDWMVRKHVASHSLSDLEIIQLVVDLLPAYRAMPGQTEKLLYEAIDRRLSWNKIRALNWLEEANQLDAVLAGEKDIFEVARSLGLASDKRGTALGMAYGHGDKFDEVTQPLKRYLAAWKRKGYEFRHVNPKEAQRRLLLIDSLIAELQATRPDLEKRAVTATLSAPPERKRR